MQFANPIWLWALTGLSIPVGIHLLSRKEGKVIRIGSIRHLEETNTQQFKGIRLNEIVLLALRCLMIVLFVLLISGLSFNAGKNTGTKWALVEKGLENFPAVKAQIDDFRKQDFEIRILATGFPLLADSSSLTTPVHYRKLSEELKAQTFSEAVVISKNRVNSFSGMRSALPSNVRWIGVPAEAMNYTLNAIAVNDSVLVRTGHTSGEKTDFTTETFSQVSWNKPAENQVTINIVILSDELHLHDRKIVTALLFTIDMAFPVEIQITNTSPGENPAINEQDWCIWLTDKPLPASITTNCIYLKPGAGHSLLLQETAKRWILTKRLNEETALNNNLTVRLADLLISSKKDWETASQKDSRMLPDSIAWNNGLSARKDISTAATHTAESYLLALFFITLLIERLIAYHKNQ